MWPEGRSLEFAVPARENSCCRGSHIRRDHDGETGIKGHGQGNMRRAIDIREGEKIKEAGFKELIRLAVAANAAARRRTGEESLTERWVW